MIPSMRQKLYQKYPKITDFFRTTKKISTTGPATVDLVAKQDEASGSPRSLQTQRSNPSAHHQEDGPTGFNSKDTSRGRPDTTGRVAGKSKASLSRSRSVTVTNLITVITKIRDEGYEQYPGTEVRAQTRLDPLGYDKFLERLDQPKYQKLRNYINAELRVDYSPNGRELTILMPTDIHDGLGAEIVELIGKKFDRIGQGRNCDDPIRKATNKIKSHGTSGLEFDDMRFTREPDGSFVHNGCPKQEGPAWVIEVNWARRKTRQECADRAKELIRLSKGEIRTVVDVDLGEIYRAGVKNGVKTGGPAPALLSIWRSPIEDSGGESGLTAHADPKEMVFRDERGKEVESSALRLSLANFMCRDCAAALPGSEDTMIVISSGELCEMFETNMKKHRAKINRRAQKGRVDTAATVAHNEEQEATTQSESLVAQEATPPAEDPPPQEPPSQEPPQQEPRRSERRKWRLGFKGSYKGMQ